MTDMRMIVLRTAVLGVLATSWIVACKKDEQPPPAQPGQYQQQPGYPPRPASSSILSNNRVTPRSNRATRRHNPAIQRHNPATRRRRRRRHPVIPRRPRAPHRPRAHRPRSLRPWPFRARRTCSASRTVATCRWASVPGPASRMMTVSPGFSVFRRPAFRLCPSSARENLVPRSAGQRNR